jgi:predicted peroxiredoxin
MNESKKPEELHKHETTLYVNDYILIQKHIHMTPPKLLYVVTGGPERSTQAMSALMLATTAASAGNKAVVFFHLDGVKSVTAENVMKTKLEGFPGLLETVEHALSLDVQLYSSEESLMIHGLTSRDMMRGVEVVGSAKLNDLMLSSDAVLSL